MPAIKCQIWKSKKNIFTAIIRHGDYGPGGGGGGWWSFQDIDSNEGGSWTCNEIVNDRVACWMWKWTLTTEPSFNRSNQFRTVQTGAQDSLMVLHRLKRDWIVSFNDWLQFLFCCCCCCCCCCCYFVLVVMIYCFNVNLLFKNINCKVLGKSILCD